MKNKCLMFMMYIGAIALIISGCKGSDGAAGADGAAGTSGADYPGTAPAAYTAADAIKGGTAYSKWYVTQADGQGALADYTVPVTAGSDFVRCKACHAWDGLGNNGSYANRTGTSTGKSSRPDVSSLDLRDTVQSVSYTALFDLIKNSDGRDINTEGNAHPDYSDYLTDAQIWNIVKFMKEEWVSPDSLYKLAVEGPAIYTDGAGTAHAPKMVYYGIGEGGNATNGATIYTEKCASCHGTTGNTLDADMDYSIGGFVRNKPNEAWFKAKFGEPGKMDAGIVTSTSDLSDLYAALKDMTNFPAKTGTEVNYASADGIKGGIAYSKWYVTEADGKGALTDSDSSTETADYNISAGSDFVRCKACHAWDGLGNAASYANRTGQSTGKATRPDVSSVNLRNTLNTLTNAQLFNAIKGEGNRNIDSASNAHPDYSNYLTDGQIWNIVKFMREEWELPSEFYTLQVTGPSIYTDASGDVQSPTLTYSDIGTGGTAADGLTVYSSNCSSCHGTDGKTIDLGGKSMGKFLRDKPNELWFKAKFGEPGKTAPMNSSMVSSKTDLLNLYKELTDSTTYPD